MNYVSQKLCFAIPLFLMACFSSPARDTILNACPIEQENNCRKQKEKLYKSYKNATYGRKCEENSFSVEFKKELEEFIKECENCQAATEEDYVRRQNIYRHNYFSDPYIEGDIKTEFARIKEQFGIIKSCFEDMKQDSIEKANFANAKEESIREISTLVEKDSAETEFVLNKCKEHKRTYNELLPVCSQFEASRYLATITAWMKEDKLEECVNACEKLGFGFSNMFYYERKVDSLFVEKFEDLCKKQLPDKIKKLPLKKINSQTLAEAYFSPFLESTSFVFQKIPKNFNVQLQGKVIQNDGKKAILELTRDYDFIVKHSGQCFMREGAYLNGFGKYLGEETYNSIFGARTLPVFQLLWCPE